MSKGFLTADQREQLNTYPKELSNTDIGRFFTLTQTDLLKVSKQRSDHNRIGFALQLCTLRYLGFIPNNLLDAPQTVVRLLAHQLGISPQAINIYGERQQTKSDHLSQIMQYEGYRRASTDDMQMLEAWLIERAIAFLKQTLFLMTDIALDLFDACLWQRHTDAKKELDEMRLKAARSTNQKLRTYSEVVKILIDGEVKDAAVRAKVFRRFNRSHLQQIVEETENHLRPDNDEAIDLFAQRYSYIRQFAPRLLATLTFQSHQPASPLLDAIKMLKTLNASGQRTIPKDAPTAFVTDVWRDYVVEPNGTLNRRYYELAVLWELRQALRSGDLFVEHARRYADPNTYLIPRGRPAKRWHRGQDWPENRQEVIRLTGTPATGETRLREREAELQLLVERVETLHAERGVIR